MDTLDRSATIRERLSQVFQHLKALHEMRYPVQREVDNQPWKIWLTSLPVHPSIERGAFEQVQSQDASDENLAELPPILKVRRPRLSHPPQPPQDISDWLEPGWENPENSTVKCISKSFVDDTGNESSEAIEDDPSRGESLKEWLFRREQWVRSELPARRAMRVFETLYALHATLEREGERYELMLGDGLLSWSRDDCYVHHPVLLLRVELVFDPSTPEFSIVASEYPPELYLSLFRGMGDVSAEAVNRLRDELSQNQWHPLGGEETSQFLKRLATELSPTQGQFVTEDEPSGRAPAGPRVRRSPVIFLRPRTLGLSTAVDSILEDIPTRAGFPSGLASIVGVEDSGRVEMPGEVSSVQADLNGEDEHILLSKEANANQLEIARRLEGYGSVLVQGPPGTGKTHTIANLLGHLLAQGKSVLVTAHTPKALRVLRDYVVEALQPLCVSVLDGTSEQLRNSVEAISSKLSSSTYETLVQEAESLKQRRNSVLAQLRAARSELLQARGGEYRSIVVGGTEFAPSVAGRIVNEGTDSRSWIPAPVTPSVGLPLSVGEIADLYKSNESLTLEEENALSMGLPDMSALLLPSDFEALCSRLAEEQQSGEPGSTTGLWETEAGQSLDPEGLRRLLSRIAESGDLLSSAEPWELAIVTAGREMGARAQAWNELVEEIEQTILLASDCYPAVVRHAPVIREQLDDIITIPILEEMNEHVKRGGRFGALQLLTHRNWRTVLESTQVNGKPPRTSEHFLALIDHLRLHKARTALTQRWRRQVSELGGPQPDVLGSELETTCGQYVSRIRRLLSWFSECWQPIEAELRENGLRWDTLLSEVPPSLDQFGDLERLRVAVEHRLPSVISARVVSLEAQIAEARLQEAEELLESSNTGLAQTPPVVSNLSQAISCRNPAQYSVAYERLVAIRERQSHYQLRHNLLSRLEQAAPGWAVAIRNRDGIHGEGQAPGDPQAAWLWRQLNDEITRRASASMNEIQTRIRTLRRELSELTSSLIEKMTWAAQVRRTSLEQRLALNGWSALVKKAGRRTGKRAPALLAEARRLMPICQSAVPVWIMPLNQVFDSFDPKRNRFDVVIVDEASQADITSLAAVYLGTQLIVVGDDEQVTPEAVGLPADDVRQLIDALLKGIPNRMLYDGQTSLYDLAKTSFGGVVMLHEHFRCVPDIIQFSNWLSYDGKIQALRDSSAVKLRPHTVAYRVNGEMTGSHVNEVEARAIASLLIAAIEQPEYSEASFGVMPMVGSSQAASIDLLLREFLAPNERHRRRIQCGTPAQFQGDERDVIFLSMVYSPRTDGHRLGLVPDPGQRMKKRFNVAASRARDQLWVVHSVDPDSDLQSSDIRRSLIIHARDPKAADTTLVRLEPRVESEFEKRVLRDLVSFGYNVVPQVRVGPYRIDLVVQHEGIQLAVECDGDRYHGADRLEKDCQRQSVLERMGWQFVRIRGSEYFRDPRKALVPLIGKLDEMGIHASSHVKPVKGVVGGTLASDSLLDRVIRRAEEIRREWGGNEGLPIDESGWRAVHPGISRAAMTRANRQQTSVDSDPKDDGSVACSEEVPSPGLIHELDVRVKTDDQQAMSPGSEDVAIAQTHPSERFARSDSSIHLARGSRDAPKRHVPESAASAEELISALKRKGLEVIDKRPVGGALWVVGGPELADVLNEFMEYGHRFSFAAKGGRASRHRPAWYTK